MRRAQQLGRYHLLDRIAFGGMAEIYRAKTFDGQGHAAPGRGQARAGAPRRGRRLHPDARRRGEDRRVLQPRATSRASTSSRARTASTSSRWSTSTARTCAPCSSAAARRRSRSRPSTRRTSRPEVGARAARRAHARSIRAAARCASSTATCRRRTCICSYAGEVKLCDFGIAKATLSRVTDQDRRHQGQGQVHEPRAGARPQARPPQRRVLAGLVPLRDADAHPAVHRDQRDGPAHQGARRASTGAVGELHARHPARARGDLRQVPDAQPREPLPDRRRGRGRPARVPPQVHAELLAQPPRPVHPQDASRRRSSASCACSKST